MAERIRAHAAGIPAFFTPTGASTAVEQGSIPVRYKDGGFAAGVLIPGVKKETKVFNGKKYVMEPAIAGDVAFIRAWKVDEVGNCVFRCVSPFPFASYNSPGFQIRVSKLQYGYGQKCKTSKMDLFTE